jgi:hypothetical protein
MESDPVKTGAAEYNTGDTFTLYRGKHIAEREFYQTSTASEDPACRERKAASESRLSHMAKHSGRADVLAADCAPVQSEMIVSRRRSRETIRILMGLDFWLSRTIYDTNLRPVEVAQNNEPYPQPGDICIRVCQGRSQH